MEPFQPTDDAAPQPAGAQGAEPPSTVLTWPRIAPGTGGVHARLDLATGVLVPARPTRSRRAVVADPRAIVNWARPRHGVDLVVARPLLWPRITLPLLDLRHHRGTPTPEELESLASLLEKHRPRLWRESVESLREQAAHVRHDGDLKQSPVLDVSGGTGLLDILQIWH